MGLKYVRWEGLDSVKGLMVGFRENGNKILGSIKGGEYIK
jgi:hypothetical protein